MTETRLYEPARLSTPPAPKFLFSLKPLDATTWLRSMLSKVFPNFYLHRCSHCLCSQACMCSCKSQLRLYNSHFCDNHGLSFRIHRCLSKETKKTRNKYKLSLIMTFISSFTFTNAPIALVARPARAVVRARDVGTVGIYVTIMASNLAFINFWRE